MKVNFIGRDFDLDKIDFINYNPDTEDWNTEDGRFFRKLKQRPIVCLEILSWCQQNIDIVIALDPPKNDFGDPVSYFKDQFEKVRNHRINLAEFFVHKVLTKHPRPYRQAIRAVFEKHSGVIK